LESELDLDFMSLEDLNNERKDGALVLTLQVDFWSASTRLAAPAGHWALVKEDGSRAGTRHAAMVDMLDFQGNQRIPGDIMARSDAGGVHVGWPMSPKELALVFHLQQEKLNDNCSRLFILKVSLHRLQAKPRKETTSASTGSTATLKQSYDRTTAAEVTALFSKCCKQDRGCHVSFCLNVLSKQHTVSLGQ